MDDHAGTVAISSAQKSVGFNPYPARRSDPVREREPEKSLPKRGFRVRFNFANQFSHLLTAFFYKFNATLFPLRCRRAHRLFRVEQ